MGVETGKKNPQASLKEYGFEGLDNIYWNLSPEELVEHTIRKEVGELSDTGAICIKTGKFTGRAPGDKFIVKDDHTQDSVNWNNINQPFDLEKYEELERDLFVYFKGKEAYVKDAYACSDTDYRLNIRVISETPWSSQFAHNMFLRLDEKGIRSFEPDWLVINAPGFEADPDKHGTKRGNFAIIHFRKKRIIIGGSGYTGEIKKGIFSVLNYILPHEENVLSMHCSANVGLLGDTAIFFGLSGTGKTTLSADPDRALIGDDEHGWSDSGVFNFEGGCYAKCIGLTEEKEPEIYHAIRHGAILENIRFIPGTRTPDFEDSSITENTRVSYPIEHISNALEGSMGNHPKNIFFLTCDAFGVLPPISRLSPGQAMYHFISGYTAKVAGTEEGVTEPTVTFSACFGAPFLPLHPTKYAEMLGNKMREHGVNIWLVNTGWTGGEYGVGNRINLKYTRAMISAALEGELDQVDYMEHETFGLRIPTQCPNVPSSLLDPRNTWDNVEAYDRKARHLAQLFIDNFRKFESMANDEILSAGPAAKTAISG